MQKEVDPIDWTVSGVHLFSRAPFLGTEMNVRGGEKWLRRYLSDGDAVF